MKKEHGLKEIIAYEKVRMHPLVFTVSYILTPVYAVVSILLIAAFGVLMELDEKAYLIHALVCLGAFVLISVAFLASVPGVRKKVLRAELDRYDFDTSKEESRETYDFSTEDFSLKFDKYGMYVEDKLYYYNHLQKLVLTDNFCRRVNICLQFYLSPGHYVRLGVNPTTLKMVECLKIPFENGEVLSYILSNKEDAFLQIHNKGYVTVRQE